MPTIRLGTAALLGLCGVCLRPTEGKARYCPGCRPEKYGAKKVTQIIGGKPVTFHSKKEAKRWTELTTLEAAGAIANLRRQVPFVMEVNGVKVATYWADFVYDEAGAQVVEDTKSEPTRTTSYYRLKKRLLKACLGVDIKES